MSESGGRMDIRLGRGDVRRERRRGQGSGKGREMAC
jgi:hypothetical protein